LRADNDADLEMRDLAQYADELDNETCRACGEAWQSVTIDPQDGPGSEAYQCACGHVTRWDKRGRRLS
jgi:hypothetical protein